MDLVWHEDEQIPGFQRNFSVFSPCLDGTGADISHLDLLVDVGYVVDVGPVKDGVGGFVGDPAAEFLKINLAHGKSLPFFSIIPRFVEKSKMCL